MYVMCACTRARTRASASVCMCALAVMRQTLNAVLYLPISINKQNFIVLLILHTFIDSVGVVTYLLAYLFLLCFPFVSLGVYIDPLRLGRNAF